MIKTYEEYRDEMWNDPDVVEWVRQCMNDYVPDIHGKRAHAELQFREEYIRYLWNNRSSRKDSTYAFDTK